MNEITITVGEELFQFTSFNDWVNNAMGKFLDAGVEGRDVICVDGKGRVVKKGAEFQRARDENAFPVRVYRALCE